MFQFIVQYLIYLILEIILRVFTESYFYVSDFVYYGKGSEIIKQIFKKKRKIIIFMLLL